MAVGDGARSHALASGCGDFINRRRRIFNLLTPGGTGFFGSSLEARTTGQSHAAKHPEKKGRKPTERLQITILQGI